MYLEIGCLLLLLIIYVSYIYLRGQTLPPGPWGFPFVGFLPFLSPIEPHVTLSNLAKKYGPIYGINLGSIYAVILSDPTLIRDALKRDDFTGRAPLYITHGIMGGFGLICAEGSLWRDQRRLSISWLREMGMMKFGSTRAELESRIMSGVNESIEKFSELSKKYFNMNPFQVLHHTLGNIMNDLVFGIKYEEDDKTWIYLQKLQEEGVKHIGVSGAVNFLPLLRFLPGNQKTIEFLMSGKGRTHKIYDEIIGKCENALKTKNANEIPKCVLEHYLRERQKREANNESSLEYCSNEQLRHLLADLFGAGVDTTLTTLRWFLLYIAKYPGIQNRLRDEMKTNLSSAPTLDDYNKLTYMRAAISETQRIRSVVPLGIPHGAIADTELCGYRIPMNSMIIPLQWAIHMDPEKWEDPDYFNPKRFINEMGEYTAPANFMPFQTGKRMCLGDELAKMLLFLYASNILYNFEMSIFATDSNLNMKGNCGITLTPNDYNLVFKKIKIH